MGMAVLQWGLHYGVEAPFHGRQRRGFSQLPWLMQTHGKGCWHEGNQQRTAHANAESHGLGQTHSRN